MTYAQNRQLSFFTIAAENGHLEIINFFSEKCPWNEWACLFAALDGHIYY